MNKKLLLSVSISLILARVAGITWYYFEKYVRTKGGEEVPGPREKAPSSGTICADNACQALRQ